VQARADASRHSFLSEAAFYSLFSDSTTAEADARRFVTRLPRGAAASARITRVESIEVNQLKDNLTRYLQTNLSVLPTFLPEFPGCGVVEPARGDILLGSELIEVKAVQRTFRGLDLRQAITYSALAHSNGQSVSFLTLLNPRWGMVYSSDVENLAMDVGAGSWVELMKDLIDAMSGIEVSL
jgi:hypothetical protein